jgi:hypothetical protein
MLVQRAALGLAVARLADALLAFDAAARVRRRHQAQAACQLASVGEMAPAKDLIDQNPGPLGPDGPQSHQLVHQRLLALGQFQAVRAFDGQNLFLDQPQAFALPLKLGAQQGRHLVAMGGPPLGPVPAADHDARTQVVQHQQRADAVRVRDALVCYSLQLARRSLRQLEDNPADPLCLVIIPALAVRVGRPGRLQKYMV